PFAYSPQPIEATAVAVAATRGGDGHVRAFLSVAPLVNGVEVGSIPPGDGDLIRETADGGWQDLSLSQYPGIRSLPGDGAVKSDPGPAIAPDPAGGSVWAVGGYAGGATAAGQGSSAILPSRSPDWYTAAVWRFDAAGPSPPIGLEPTTISLAARPGT